MTNSWNITINSDDAAGIACIAPQITALASSLLAAVEHPENIQCAWELFDKLPSVGRSVVQVHVSTTFFETFFNSADGYRAMFRRGPFIGSATNAALVREVTSSLAGRLSESMNVQVTKNPGPKWVGCLTLHKTMFLRSLDPSLAKIWYSTAEIGVDGKIRLLPSGVANGKIDVGLSCHWAEIRQDQQDCVIEIKGAFIGPFGLFQVKDPEQRAHKLFERGDKWGQSKIT